MSDDTDIPESVEEMLTPEEIENIENRDGWAIGDVVLVENGNVGEQTIEDAVIELFNGEGAAGEFGGVRFMAETAGDYTEAYAYATVDAFEQSGGEDGWYVESWTDPEDPDYGDPAPR